MRHFLAPALALLTAPALASGPLVTVEKSPTCGCCTAWVEHMAENGYEVEVRDVDGDTLSRTKARLGIAPEHQSCHTAMVDGCVIEGHVPAADVTRLLEERPEAMGLSAPGMPAGSPGMETGGPADPYDVLLLERDGDATVFEQYR